MVRNNPNMGQQLVTDELFARLQTEFARLQNSKSEIETEDARVSQKIEDVAAREEAVTRREEAVASRESTIYTKEEVVREDHVALTDREEKIASREDDAEKRETSVLSREEELSGQAKALEQMEAQAREREASNIRKQTELEAAETVIKQREQAVTSREQEIAEEAEALGIREEVLLERKRELEEREIAVKRREERLAEQDQSQEVENLQQELDAKAEEVTMLRQEIGHQQAQWDEAEDTCRDKDAEIHQLRHTVHQQGQGVSTLQADRDSNSVNPHHAAKIQSQASTVQADSPNSTFELEPVYITNLTRDAKGRYRYTVRFSGAHSVFNAFVFVPPVRLHEEDRTKLERDAVVQYLDGQKILEAEAELARSPVIDEVNRCYVYRMQVYMTESNETLEGECRIPLG